MWYLVISRLAGSEEGRQSRLKVHQDWLLAQHRAGRIIFSGPTADRSCGIFIVLAADRGEAERIAAEDPHHVHGDRAMEILEWDPQRAMRLEGPTVAEIEAMATGDG